MDRNFWLLMGILGFIITIFNPMAMVGFYHLAISFALLCSAVMFWMGKDRYPATDPISPNQRKNRPGIDKLVNLKITISLILAILVVIHYFWR